MPVRSYKQAFYSIYCYFRVEWIQMGSTTRAIETPTTVDLNRVNWAQCAHNFLMKRKSGEYSVDELNILNEYVRALLLEAGKEQKAYKIGLMFIAVNPHYWGYAKQVIDGVRQFFLPGHETEIMLWTDMQNWAEAKDVNFGATVFGVDQMDWPYPTLMRYHFFLKQEEYLKKFDYIFYLDLDMRLVGIVGDEILGDGLTAAPHPGYYIRKEIIPPYEPNRASSAYIDRPGAVIDDGGRPRFIPHYYAGGFQGGRTEFFLEAMKSMQKSIDIDMDNGYIAIWNDESHWNKYLSEYSKSGKSLIMLGPSYVYPDSMVNEYYVPKVWGRNFTPRIITITKPFSLSKEGGTAAQQMMS